MIVLGIIPLAEGLRALTRTKNKLSIIDNPMQDALLSRFSNVASKVQVNSAVKNIDYTGSKLQ